MIAIRDAYLLFSTRTVSSAVELAACLRHYPRASCEQGKAVQATISHSNDHPTLFYDRLFDIAPQMKAMFPDDMIEQRRKLMAMLAGVVKGSRQTRTGFAGRQRTGKAARQLRCEGGALSGGRRRIGRNQMPNKDIP